MSNDRISSPAATGGAGTFFEQHVDAYWLAQLLVRGIPPILHDCAVIEVHFQTEQLGWKTDDFLVIGENGAGTRRKLVGQVKRTFTVSATDDECKKAIKDFWTDFKNGQQFSPAIDRFALVTLRGTNTLLEHFAGLLDCSRAARDGADFERRLATPGFINAKAIQYCDEIQTIVGESEGRSITEAEVWPFLRVLHVLSLDLNSATRQTEAMIKTLLAHTTGEQDALGVAQASWDALLRVVGEGMPEARAFGRNDLPDVLLQRHSPVGGVEQRALRALNDHSGLILAGIRSMIGRDLHLGRDRMVQQVIEQLESTQIVLVSGGAGSGKSGIAKDAIGILAADHFAFGFRAEEFALPHFDGTLQRNQIPASAAMLGAILSAQGRKVLLIESVERLLEAATRDAFTDLLTLVARDMSWRVLLTCRDYSTDLVRACFLESANVGHSVVTVPPLDDAELAEVEAAHPTLARPLGSTALRRLLRNPYILDKALQIPWSEERPLPQSEREFRLLFWQEIVRADHRAAGGMPHRREDAFVMIALKRARALTLYAACGDLDPEVIDGLRHDALIVSPKQINGLVAPAHDVLEDWAILQWIDEQYAMHQGSAGGLSAVLGTYPAIRRTYRKWVSELVERDADAADRLLRVVVHEAGLPTQFRDDTLVSLLRSPTSPAFLERHLSELFANDKQLLRRVIHLLRVACVTTLLWLKGPAAHASLFNVPDGPAWACVLRLVQGNFGLFAENDRLLLLGLIEDWARGVSWQSPYPEGFESVAAIAHWLLPNFDDYDSDEERKRTLQVIAKIPNGDRERFAALLEAARNGEERDRAAEDFREIIFEGLEGMPAARDMPGLVVLAATDYLICTEADVQTGWSGGSMELEPLFGIKHNRSHGHFPASAYRGPFLPLLRQHLSKGLDFVISIFNHSAEWYAHPRVRSEYVAPPFEIALSFGDGTSQVQWCNDRLWNLYRGTSVGPYVLQSILMALERALLEVAEAQPRQLDSILLRILRRSTSAALTAVVASVATAFPHASGEALLILLSSPACILLDRQRLVHESQAPSNLSGLMPQVNASNAVYDEERKEADTRANRRQDLEMAIANLQFGPFAPRVRETLDSLRAQLPAVDRQTEDDRIWRLAMHRMDLRQYTVAEEATDSPTAPDDQNASNDGRKYVRLDLKAPEPDVKKMVDQSAAQFQTMNARLALQMWGLKVYERDESTTHDPSQWRQRLREAHAICTEPDDLGRDGPGIVAAVCVRDHWEELSNDDRNWCVNIVCSEVERDANQWNRIARLQRHSMSADRPCAWVLPLLLGKPLAYAQQTRVRQVLVVALTHPIDEVRSYAAWGIGKHLWAIDRDLALRCVNALAMEATSVQKAVDADAGRPYVDRQQIDELETQAATLIRKSFFEPEAIADSACQALEAHRWFGAEANLRILAILGQSPNEPLAIATFGRLTHTLVAWWDADDNRHRHRDEMRQERSHETEAALTDLLENFLLRTSALAATTILQPILDVVDRHTREVHWLIRGLTRVEDHQPNTPQFWSLWELFAERVRHAKWLAGIDGEHASGNEMMTAIFLSSGWKKNVRHWPSLEGHAEHVHSLFNDLPPSATALDDYVRFLYHIGEQSLPEAFVRIATHSRQASGRHALKSNTIYMLEVLLRRHVYTKPLEIKQNAELRDAILQLLELLIDQGSSAAFRMRDDFVTPIAIG